jgi:ABC-type nitrate/sulfonate/bicarbonate transport system substrate-binding protein
MRRRAFVAGALAMPFVARAATAEKLTIISPGAFGIDFAEIMNAVSGGHLARAGFDPTLLGVVGQASANNQVIAGQASFTRSAALDLFLAAGAGKPPLISVATLFQASTFHVISPANKPIRGAEEFAGKTVGVVSVKGTTELLLDLMLRKVGIPREQVARVAVGNNPGELQLVEQGRIDCFIASVSVVAALSGMGADVEVWNTDRYAPMPSQCWVTTPDVIARDPDMVVRFLRALNASCQEMISGDDAAILARISHDFDIPGARNPGSLLAVIQAMKKLWLSQGEPALLHNIPALWQAGGEAVRDAGIAPVPDVTAFYTETFIDQTLKG